VYRGTSSAYQQFWLAQGATTIAPGAGVLEQIVQRSGDGSSLVRTPKNTLESFLPSGLLGSRNFADGVAHSLQYSTTTTPRSGCAVAWPADLSERQLWALTAIDIRHRWPGSQR